MDLKSIHVWNAPSHGGRTGDTRALGGLPGADRSPVERVLVTSFFFYIFIFLMFDD
jgi:hypothetical protein